MNLRTSGATAINYIVTTNMVPIHSALLELL